MGTHYYYYYTTHLLSFLLNLLLADFTSMGAVLKPTKHWKTMRPDKTVVQEYVLSLLLLLLLLLLPSYCSPGVSLT